MPHPIASLNSFHSSLSNSPVRWNSCSLILKDYLAFDLTSIQGLEDTAFRSRRLADRKAFEIFQRFLSEAAPHVEPKYYRNTCLLALRFAKDAKRHRNLENEDLACNLLAHLVRKDTGIYSVQQACNRAASCLSCFSFSYEDMEQSDLQEQIAVLEASLRSAF